MLSFAARPVVAGHWPRHLHLSASKDSILPRDGPKEDKMATKVLMAGESWMTHSTHVKGFDSFTTSSYNEGGTELIAALHAGGVDVTYQPAHVAADHFPATREALEAFEVVILSDIGANTLLLPQRTFVRSD